MITTFFEDTEIFLTGGSGVVGKALIDMLLRNCNVKKIYILLRPKKNMTLEQRLEKIKQAMIFRQLRIQKPNVMEEKIVPIPGDAILPLLGITPEYMEVLKNVSVVYHCAATVRFDESLRDALELNVGGTLEALKFAESLKQLKVFMHVSTFYSNPYLTYVEPKLYESPMDWEFCLNLVRRNDISEDELDIITRKLIIGFPNTYCFTKNLAESLVNDFRNRLPVAIYRPSIVLFAIKQPEPGFSPSLMGAMGLFAVTMAGILKTLYLPSHVRLDITPHDYGIIVLLYQTVKTAKMYSQQSLELIKEVPVSLFSTCTINDITFAQYVDMVQDYGFWGEAACQKNFLIPGLVHTSNRFYYLTLFYLKQFIPAVLVDALLKLSGRKPLLLAAQRKIFHTLEVMKPFMFNNFESPGVTDIADMDKDLKYTNFEMIEVHRSSEHFINVGWCQKMVYSIREVLLKENPKTLTRARRTLTAKIWLYRLFWVLMSLKLYERSLDYIGSSWEQFDFQQFNEALVNTTLQMQANHV